MNKPYSILLYYCYTQIENAEAYRDEHHLLCLELNLLGRIIVSDEGLNGTVSGLKEDCDEYMRRLHADPRFGHTDFKVDPSDVHAFTKLHVRYKPEIVHSGLRHIDPNQRTGVHLSPQEFKELKDKEDVVVLDVRSDYEHSVGRFKNAVTLDIENFREFPDKVDELKEKYKDKKILTYCTGGIKCEKASAFLLEQGFENVYQLHGGIIKYGMEAGGEDFEGKCYVFDNRVAVDVNKVNPTVVSTCHVCGTKSDRMVNCANPVCNLHVPICENCGVELDGACSVECKEHPDKRPYDGTGYYQKEMNGYNPLKGFNRKKKSDVKV
ncbi:oxygen-dependent tRNA uridine(34) hydroxylase TrhO [Pontibacter cellulosilyticus]|uniref:tRNA uridine(34) hydroxylase n=1 Tax=Pontibacter cellulosilyticus TaxID=1720253 RepID=A0A923SJ12_9BACT|nr:rhodanese-related sulfurtransferase [Pontibacter cellulosilyticus]MBC5993323.1 rhodanese-related sulfurtransferase [Pontibacter cellulosilyticus]